MQQDEVIMSKLLALKANQDPENGVNKKGIADLHQNTGSSGNPSCERDLMCLVSKCFATEYPIYRKMNL